MIKKVISIVMICVMLVTISPAVAADNASVQPTVEEILNEYRLRAFEAEIGGNADAASNYSNRSGSTSQNLEQEAVDALTDAGYEAYHVTADNYDTLEADLCTDFADMGLDPDGSYIVVISGEDSEDSPSSNSRIIDPEIGIENPGPGSGAPSFSYTYNGTTFKLRYLTVTSLTGYYLVRSAEFDIVEDMNPSHWNKVLTYSLSYAMGTVGSLIELALDLSTNENYTINTYSTLEIDTQSVWTLEYIQIWDAANAKWKDGQCSSYAVSTSYCSGLIYDSATHSTVVCSGVPRTFRTYSPHYFNSTQRKNDACKYYLRGELYYDNTGDIHFYLINPEGDVNIFGEGTPLFTHPDWGI